MLSLPLPLNSSVYSGVSEHACLSVCRFLHFSVFLFLLSVCRFLHFSVFLFLLSVCLSVSTRGRPAGWPVSRRILKGFLSSVSDFVQSRRALVEVAIGVSLLRPCLLAARLVQSQNPCEKARCNDSDNKHPHCDCWSCCDQGSIVMQSLLFLYRGVG